MMSTSCHRILNFRSYMLVLAGPMDLAETVVRDSRNNLGVLGDFLRAGVAGWFTLMLNDEHGNFRDYSEEPLDLVNLRYNLTITNSTARVETGLVLGSSYNVTYNSPAPAAIDACIARLNTTVGAATLCKNRVGLYNVSFYTESAGQLRFYATKGYQELLFDSMQYQATVQPSLTISPALSTAYGPGLEGAVAGFPSSVYVQGRDIYGNLLTDALPGELTWRLAFNNSGERGPSNNTIGSMTFTSTYLGSGRYILLYSAPLSGIDNIDYLLGIRVYLSRGSAFPLGDVTQITVPVQAGLSASDIANSNVADSNPLRPVDPSATSVVHFNESSMASGGIVTNMGRVRDPMTFTVIARDQSYGLLSYRLPDSWLTVSVSPAPVSVDIVQSSLGRFSVTIIVAEPGTYSLAFEGGGVQLAGNTLADKSLAGTFELIVPSGEIDPFNTRASIQAKAPRPIFLHEVVDGAAPYSFLGQLLCTTLAPNSSVFSARAGSFLTAGVQTADAYGNKVYADEFIGYDAFHMELISTDLNSTDPSQGGRRRRVMKEIVPFTFPAQAWQSEAALQSSTCVVIPTPDSRSYAVCPGAGMGSFELDSAYILVSPDGITAPISVNGTGLPVTVVHSRINPDFSLVVVTDASRNAQAGIPVSMSIAARDRFGNLHSSGNMRFTVEIQLYPTRDSSAVPIDVTLLCNPTVVLESDGLYTLTFTPATSGIHQLIVFDALSGSALGFTTLTANLVAAPVAFSLPTMRELYIEVTAGPADKVLSEVSGQGLLGGIATLPIEILVIPYDATRSPTTGQVTIEIADFVSGDALPVQYKLSDVRHETEPGSGIPINVYAVSFTIQKVMQLLVKVLVDGVELAQGPFIIQVGPAPAPGPSAAVFSTDLSSLQVVFDQDTNLGGDAFLSAAASAQCAALIDASTLAKLGTSPTCAWLDPTTFSIQLGQRATILPTATNADRFLFRSGRIFGAALNTFAVAGSISVALPDVSLDSLAPSAALAAPSLVNACDLLVLDATASSGDGGRGLQYGWSVRVTVSGLTGASASFVDDPSVQRNAVLALQALLASTNDASLLRVTASSFPVGFDLEFTLRVTNFLGLSSTTFSVVHISSSQVPFVNLLPASSVSFIASDARTIEATASAPSCSLSSSPIQFQFQWIQTDGPDITPLSADVLAMYQFSLSNRRLYLPGGLLKAGQTYTFTCSVSTVDNALPTITKTLTVTVLPTPLFAKIIGGNSSIPANAAATLRVIPFDADDESASPTAFDYTWTCSLSPTPTADGSIPASKPCFAAGAAGFTLLSTAGPTVALPESMLSETGTYTFSVNIAKEPIVPGRSLALSVFLEVLPAAALPTRYHVVISGPAARKVNPAEVISLQGEITDDSGNATNSYQWTLLSPPALSSSLASMVAGDTSSRQLVLNPNALAGGQGYVFRLQGTGAAASSYSQVYIQTDEMPWGGSLNVVPGAGREITTRFRAWASSWTDRNEDMPLSYQFFYVPNGALTMPLESQLAVEIPLGFVQSMNSLDFSLPAGIHLVGVYVIDAQGMRTRQTFYAEIPVSPSSRRLLREQQQGVLESTRPSAVPPPPLRRRLAATVARTTSLPPDFAEASAEAQARTDIASVFDPYLAASDLTSCLQFAQIFASKYGRPDSSGPQRFCASILTTTPVIDDFITKYVSQEILCLASVVHLLLVTTLLRSANVLKRFCLLLSSTLSSFPQALGDRAVGSRAVIHDRHHDPMPARHAHQRAPPPQPRRDRHRIRSRRLSPEQGRRAGRPLAVLSRTSLRDSPREQPSQCYGVRLLHERRDARRGRGSRYPADDRPPGQRPGSGPAPRHAGGRAFVRRAHRPPSPTSRARREHPHGAEHFGRRRRGPGLHDRCARAACGCRVARHGGRQCHELRGHGRHCPHRRRRSASARGPPGLARQRPL